MPGEPPDLQSPSSSVPSRANDLFRGPATRDSTDRVDQPVRIVPPIGWLALATLGGLIFASLVWGVLGRIPQTVEGNGILLRGGLMEGIVSPGDGQLVEVLVSMGDEVKEGQKLATVYQHTLESQIENQRRTVGDYKSQFEMVQSTSEKQRQSQIEFNNRQRTSVQTSISDYKQQVALLQKVVDAQTKLLQQGLIPMTTLLQSQTQLDSAQLNILQAESQLQQIETNLIQADTDARRSVDSARISLQHSESQLLNLQAQLQRNASVVSPRSGRVVSVDAAIGQNLNPGTQIVTLERSSEPMKALLFFPSGKGKEIQVGMPLQLSPETVRVDRYGYACGYVEDVGQVPATEGSMMAVVANKSLVDAVSSEGTVLKVAGHLETNASTPSGFQWSSSQGPPFGISSGTLCKARAVTMQIRPIELVIPLIKNFFGVAD
ncbi:MAG: NHLP bacteriocin system secretion protein [Spartobacteria bacterium]